MSDTRMDAARSGESKISKTLGQMLAGVRSAAVAGTGSAEGVAGEIDVAGFSAVLATMGLPGDGDVPALTLPAMGDQQLQPLQPGGEPMAVAGLLPMQGHMPWMSLIGQTAQLDGKGDADLRQGVAGDFLSGHGNAGLLAQRQALAAGAHAAFMAPALEAAAGKAGQAGADGAANAAGQAVAGSLPQDDAAKPGGLQDALTAAQLPDERQADARGAAQALEARAEHGLQLRPQAGQGGVALQGMAAVPPQELEQLQQWLKPARAGAQEADAATGKASAVEGLQAGHGIAAAMGAAHAGAQGGGQEASAFAQPPADAQAAAPSEREQEVSEQVAFWVHQKSQNAALTIEHEGAPIKVQVQLQGQEAHVRFAADDAQARDWLGSGEQQLRELLQAQGLQLAGVSISADGANAGDSARSGSQPQERAMVRMGRVQVGVDGLAAADAGQARRTGERASGVDLFV
ncbi:flagellar hook-length control protein FliK [Comamonas sp. w2-DMI]|uniref:flagellar hook-length control protein FliK n=1 Tax=Comamonas sp. w2-DMI TaxID=3126391 RepID=UPI0032E3AB76